jgi:Peptidase M15
MSQIILPGLSKEIDTDDPIYPGSNFTWDEATSRGRRIPIQTNFRGIIIPAAKITANIIEVAKALDKVRAQFGGRPININSWYRPPSVNRAVGGVADSQHILGWGVDIVVSGLDPLYVYRELSKTWPGGLGKNRYYTHADLRHLMGWQSARWDYGQKIS